MKESVIKCNVLAYENWIVWVSVSKPCNIFYLYLGLVISYFRKHLFRLK